MKFSDRLSGLLILIFGVAIVAYARTFPAMPGQSVGPSLFPTVIGSGLVLVGATLMFTGARTRSGSWIELDDWVRRPRMVFNFALVIVDLVFYALAVNWLGFFITSFVFLAALFLTFGVTRKWIAPLAVIVTMVIHYGFYTLLRVSLPWGVLGGLAW
jgi:putative tricarboxylic transport membrane protein